jgi:AMMECR1 domain-containing protein
MAEKIAREGEYLLQRRIFENRADAGIVALREWLAVKVAANNSRWPTLTGEELTRLQGECVLLNNITKLIDVGPRTQENMNG